MLRVDAGRLLADLRALAAIGGRADGGVDRVAGSEADRDARRWLIGRLRDAGLEGELDAHGNVLGRVPGSEGPWLLVGSHTDTVPAGGRYDGALGVVAALEALRTLHEAGHPLARSVEIVSFDGEEGVSGPGLAGSRALAAVDLGRSLTGYLELHIEQGPRLESEGLELGVVEAIVGIERWTVTITGQANHAGTTPMTMRRDAARAAARFIAGLRELLHEIDQGMTGNVGQLALEPGASNVIPGVARLSVDLRAASQATLDAARAAVSERLEMIGHEEGCEVAVEPVGAQEPALMEPAFVEAIARVCARDGRRSRRLVSGAGHDAMALAPHIRTGMLFVPSRGGISHSPEEHTDDDLVVLGAQALLETIIEVMAPPLTEAEFHRCCGSDRWASMMAAAGPFPTPAALYEEADRAWWALDVADWEEAFAAHPRIGERGDAVERREQAGVDGAAAATLTAIVEGNRRYEERFGRVFLVCATGKSADEMLAALRERLVCDPDTELLNAATEQAKITRLRLEGLLGPG